jgi:hypothetical protein
MKMKKKRILLLTATVAAALAVGRWWTHDDDRGDAGDPTLVFDRVWIDQFPKKPRETFNTFIAGTDEPIGIFHAGSQWKGTYEVFAHKATGDRLRIVYLQSNETETVKVRAWACKERGMDYCLEITGASRGVKRYRSMQGWEIGAGARPEQLLDRIASIVRLGAAKPLP